MEIRKVFRDTCEWHAEARRGGGVGLSTAEKLKIWVGY